MTNKRRIPAWSTTNAFQALSIEDDEEGDTNSGDLHTDDDNDAGRGSIDDNNASAKQNRDTSSPSRLTSILSSNNWRRRSDEEENGTMPSLEALKYYDAGHNSNQSKRTARHGPKTPQGVLYEDLCPGVIVWCYDIRPCPDPTRFRTW